MKRLISIAITILMLASLCLSASANEITGHTYDYDFGEKTVIFESDTPFSEEERQHIAEHLVYGDDEISTYGFNFLCLFGHNYEVGYVTTITHCVSATQPRCLKEIFEIGECTRCGATYTEQITAAYITCCP